MTAVAIIRFHGASSLLRNSPSATGTVMLFGDDSSRYRYRYSFQASSSA